MQTRSHGTVTRYRGRLEQHGITIHEDATVINHGVVHTWTTISSGTILGTGTWWARYDTSRPIGGTIARTQIIVYWPLQRQFVLPVVCAGLVCIPKTRGEGGLT